MSDWFRLMLHCNMVALQEEMCWKRHQGDVGEESQGFRGMKVPKAEGMDKLTLAMALLRLWVVMSICPLVLALWGRN